MIDVEVQNEQESGSGWTFRLRITSGDGAAAIRIVNLAWADYNLWSVDGGDAPHVVAAAVAKFLAARIPMEDLPETIDASWARRRFPDADREIPGLI